MVQDPGAQTRARSIKPLNAPQAVSVTVDVRGNPAALLVEPPFAPAGKGDRQASRAHENGRRGPVPAFTGWVNVAEITDVWKINDEWWRGREREIERICYSVELENGQGVTVFHDLVSGEWRRQAG